MMFGLSDLTSRYAVALAVAVCVPISCVGRAMRAAAVRQARAGWLSWLPVVAEVGRPRFTVQLGRGLHRLLGAGVDLPSALTTAGDMVTNRWARQRLSVVIEIMRRAIADAGLFATVRLLRAGEDGGRVGAVGRHLATTSEQDCRRHHLDGELPGAIGHP